MQDPVFLVGARRSGTTLLGPMLDGHPQIAWPGAFDFALAWPEAATGEWPDLIDYWGMLVEDRRSRTARVVIDARLPFPDLVRSLLDQQRARTHKPLFGVTAHRHFGRIRELWPDARFIYLLRDGRDVARSHVERGSAGNAWSAARLWRETEREWAATARRVPSGRRLEVRYESLVRDPAAELERICRFLDVSYSPRMLDCVLPAPHVAPDPRIAGRWRERVASRELALLEREIGAELRERGYPPSGVRPAWIPAPRRLALRAAGRIGLVRARWWRRGALP